MDSARSAELPATAVPTVRLHGISKTYLGLPSPAVSNVNLEIMEGEFFTLIGPSGCGKTTTLRMVAGLEDPTEGSIHFKGKPIVIASQRLFVPPEKRQIGMVFQSYAIWPHMTVEENVSYPLRERRVVANEIRDRVGRVLDLVGMTDFAKRSAMELSGGQQQRVALARALVYEPSLLLLDEPFSNLDAKLRDLMRYEVKLLQSKLKITVLFVTHDQVEALSLSTRLAVMNHGVVQQVGRPRDLYDHPANEFVRDFLGRAVSLQGTITEADRSAIAVRLHGSARDLHLDARDQPTEFATGQTVSLSARPEDLELRRIGSTLSGELFLVGRIETALFVGERVEYRVAVAGQSAITVFAHRRVDLSEGDDVHVLLPGGKSGLWLVRHMIRDHR